DAPVAMGESYQTNFLTPFSMRWSDLLANDTDVEGDALSTQILAVPSRGSVVMDGNGTLTYRPEANFVGTVTIVYAVSDGSLISDPQAVQIAISMPPTTVVSLSENRGGAAFTRIDAINVSSAVASTNLSESTTIAMAGGSSVSGDANSASRQSVSGNQSAAGSANIVGSANAVGGGSLGGQIVPANAAEPGGGAMDWGVRNRLETIVEDTDLAFDLARFHLNWITESKMSELAVIQRLQLDPWGRVGLESDELAFLDSVQSKKEVLLEVRNREYFVKTATPIMVGTAIGAGISLHVLMTAHFGSSLLSQSGVFMPLDPLTILEGTAKVKKSKEQEDLLFDAALCKKIPIQ
ncbi:MAG: cadherin-like domain-containing protein, partial [Planctomycetes bacterium]|nr:cadherin-like domain-containing protein [Planctomycetota bacterium]